MSRQNLRALRHPDVHTGMVVFLTADRVYPIAVVARYIRQPVCAEHILHILSVALCHEEKFTDFLLLGAHLGNHQVFHRHGRKLDIQDTPLVFHLDFDFLPGRRVGLRFGSGSDLRFLRKGKAVLAVK